MIDPILPLSISIAEGKGVYALFLGSGISRSAGIPTGGEIRWDSIKHLYKLENNVHDIPEDTEINKWFESSQYKDFNYSKILEGLCPSQEDRRNFLEKYFVGRNPSAAHDVISTIVQKNLIRVIVTTNFDQLLEKSLEKKNIDYDVVASEADLNNSKPREHSNCRLFKLHGDYKKLNILNTEKELERYTELISKELQEIFDRYGLIIVGWSGSDKAVIEHLKNRHSKYSLYWVAREEINETIHEVIKNQDGRVIFRDSAETFFTELERKINLFLTYPKGDTPEFLVAQVKDLLKSRNTIEINELAKAVIHDLTKKWEDIIPKFRNDHQNRIIHLHSLEQILDRLLAIGFILIEYGENELFNRLLRYFNTIITLSDITSSEVPVGEWSTSIGDIPKVIAAELFFLWGSFSLYIENFTAMKLLLEIKINRKNNLVPLFADPDIHYSYTVSDHFGYLLEYPKEKDYFKDFSEYKKNFKSILCQFDFITTIKILELIERTQQPNAGYPKYEAYSNFLRFEGSRIKPLILKLEHNEFAQTFSKYLFNEEPKIFLPRLKYRYTRIRELNKNLWDSLEWDPIGDILDRIVLAYPKNLIV